MGPISSHAILLKVPMDLRSKTEWKKMFRTFTPFTLTDSKLDLRLVQDKSRIQKTKQSGSGNLARCL